MVNGPMGGNMGSLPVAPQPPQVNFTTTAESRGGFNDFLRSIPSTMNMMPPSNPMGGNPMPPMGGNPMDNIDIFNQPMGMMGMNQPQMNPMMQQPMQQPMMMEYGGNVPPRETEIRGQDHMLAYITPEEGGILKALGGSGSPGPMGIPSYYDDSDGSGGDSEAGESAASEGASEDGGEGSEADGGGNESEDSSNDMGMDDDTSAQGQGPGGSDTAGDSSVGGGGSDVGGGPGGASQPGADSPDTGVDQDESLGFENVSPDEPSGDGSPPTYIRPIPVDQPNQVDAMPNIFGSGNETSNLLPSLFDYDNNPYVVKSPFTSDINIEDGIYKPIGFENNDLNDILEKLTGVPNPNRSVFGYANGGGVPPRRTEIMGQDHMLSYITPEEGGILKALGGAGRPGPMGIPSYWGGDVGDDAADAGTGPGDTSSDNDGTDTNESSTTDNTDTTDNTESTVGDDPSGPNDPGVGPDDGPGNTNDPDDAMSAANQAADISNTVGFSPESQANADTNTDDNNTNTDTSVTGISKGLTNVTNVGPTSNLSYSPQFSADVAQSQGLDPSVTMSPEDYSMTTQGKEAAAAQEAENMALDQATNNTNTMANQVQGISRGMSPGLATAMGTSLAQDPLGLSLDVPSRGFNVGIGAPQAAGAGRGTGQGFSSYGVPTDPVVGNAPGAASTTAANVAAQNAGNIAGVTTGPEMMGNIPGITLGSNPAPPGYEENVGKPYSGYNIDAIENFYNAPTTMDQLGLPPGMINSALSVVENMARDRVASDLISGNYTAITDSNGNITGSRDSFGRVHSGMDFNAPDTSPSEGGNSINPISRNTRTDPLLPQDPFSMGIFGNAEKATAPNNPFLVDSPFTSNIADSKPVDFSSGDLNALIAKLTGVAAPKGMAQGGIARYAEGGLISAVDRFLASA